MSGELLSLYSPSFGTVFWLDKVFRILPVKVNECVSIARGLSEFAHAIVSVSIARAFSRIRARVAPRVLQFSAFILGAKGTFIMKAWVQGYRSPTMRLLQVVMSVVVDSQSQKLLGFVTFTVFFLVLGSYQWQYRKSCSSITTPLLPPPVVGHRAEHTSSCTPNKGSWVSVSIYHCSFTSLQRHNCRSVYFDGRHGWSPK